MATPTPTEGSCRLSSSGAAGARPTVPPSLASLTSMSDDTPQRWLAEEAEVRQRLQTEAGLATRSQIEGFDRPAADAGHAVGAAPAATDFADAGFHLDVGERWRGGVPRPAAVPALQPSGHCAWRLVCHLAGFGLAAPCTPLMPVGRAYTTLEFKGEPGACADREGARRARRGPRAASGRQVSTAGGQSGGPRRHRFTRTPARRASCSTPGEWSPGRAGTLDRLGGEADRDDGVALSLSAGWFRRPGARPNARRLGYPRSAAASAARRVMRLQSWHRRHPAASARSLHRP